ncbi:sodium- and chloride-dependent glycine transporter 1 [Patella vulgata]|uniref:sodium- and chloride-dependent glycine transporter 1 n=1 Tax=Patella vulgata TaxID=6465 RepID=UPI0024A9595D|nr:sodium- and chloride-dependent glycine transporter 1 [Patella vulgata]XP_055955384.1 sodium- and chloride-dependent glycine transporter 1 [Patella vulgata]XP_055955385.1 sodium- and chloride-dependent glycine transporter 1 [Patella vulgata]
MANEGNELAASQELQTFLPGGKRKEKRATPVDNGVNRDQWTRQFDFVLSLIGYAVGVGNLWRFPYLCLRNGGGAFLIPFFFFLILCGIPLFYLEVCLGQFSGTSSLFVWKMCPLFKGVGYGMVIVSGMATIYYNGVITWVLYYLVSSFQQELPWQACGHWWNTPTCRDNFNLHANSSINNGSYYNNTEFTTNFTNIIFDNGTSSNSSELVGMTAAEEFWQYNVLRKSSGLHELGQVQGHISICLLVAWVLVFLCLIKGVKSLGYVVYVTALLPYVLLTIFLIRGCMLPGALDGILFYITPDFSKLLTFSVWTEACLQVFYSLGPAWGGIITMSSFNKFHHNCFRDAVVATLADGLTSFYGGFVIFAVLGFMAKEAGVSVTQIATEGPGLALVAYPAAITKLPLPQFWAVLFFLMLLLLGLDSQFGMFESLVSGIVDAFPKQLSKHRMWVTAGLTALCYLVGLPIATNGGIYVFQLMDWFVAAFCVLVISFLECLIIGWIYGVERFCKDIELMTGRKPGIIIKICWCFITPFLMILSMIFTISNLKMPTYDGYIYPEWARFVGFLLSVIPLIPIPLFMVIELYKADGNLFQKFRQTLRPAADWGPSYKEYKHDYSLKEHRHTLPFIGLIKRLHSNNRV